MYVSEVFNALSPVVQHIIKNESRRLNLPIHDVVFLLLRKVVSPRHGRIS